MHVAGETGWTLGSFPSSSATFTLCFGSNQWGDFQASVFISLLSEEGERLSRKELTVHREQGVGWPDPQVELGAGWGAGLGSLGLNHCGCGTESLGAGVPWMKY